MPDASLYAILLLSIIITNVRGETDLDPLSAHIFMPVWSSCRLYGVSV